MNILEQLCTPGAGLAAVIGFMAGVIFDRIQSRRHTS